MGSPDYSDGCMIALYPPPELAEQLAIPNGLPPDELHITIAYLGDADQVDHHALQAATQAATAGRPPIKAAISGHARFTGGPQDVIVALLDSPDIETLRRDLTDRLTEQGIPLPREHGFVPHCTLAYIDPEADSPVDRQPATEVTFTALAAVHGTDRTDHPLAPAAEHHLTRAAADGAPYFRTAYAQGWAASGGPMTERVKAGCTAAVTWACEHPDRPDILEVTLNLGALEGAWALVYQRREDAYRHHTATVTALWRKILATLPLADALRRLLADLDTDSTAAWGAWDATASCPSDADIAGRASAATRSLFLGTVNPAAPTYIAIVTAIATALRDSDATGRASALTVAHAHTDSDYDRDLEQAKAALPPPETYWAAATSWLNRITNATTADLARALTKALRAGADYQQLHHAAHSVINAATGGIRAVTTLLDMAMSQALARGATNLYGAQAVQTVDYVTAGDGHVCAQCEQYETDGPYPLGSAPEPGWHPLCRCVLVPADHDHPLTPYIPTAA